MRILLPITFALLLAGVCSCARVPYDKQIITAANVEAEPELNLRPIIGVLTQPGQPAPKGTSYVAASYVKWIESAGARVIPILYDFPKEEVIRRFNIVNGVLIPGGGAILKSGNQFFDTASLLFNLTIEANDKGDYFPLQGICLGLEALSVIMSGNTSILGNYNAMNTPARLLLTNDGKGSRLFNALPPDVVLALQEEPIAMENHEFGLSTAAFLENPGLSRLMRMLSLSLDRDGRSYVSTLEGRDYPITATQWHPEKNIFEWTTQLQIPHSSKAIRASQAVADYLVQEARRNQHHARDLFEEDDLLIYNFNPVFIGKLHNSTRFERDFEQIYVFPDYASQPVMA